MPASFMAQHGPVRPTVLSGKVVLITGGGSGTLSLQRILQYSTDLPRNRPLPRATMPHPRREDSSR